MSDNSGLVTDGLTVGYSPRPTLAKHLALEARHGELVAVVGPNGAGKSTLIRVLSGLEPPLSGMVRVDGRNIHEIPPATRSRQVGIGLPHHETPPHLRVDELVALGRYPYTSWFGGLTEGDRRYVTDALRVTGIQSLAQRELATLSDGEVQKAHIARGIAQQAPLLLLDEPTAYLDVTSRFEITHMLRDLAHREGRIVLFSTHDLSIALETADRMWLFVPALEDSGVGAQVVDGAPEDLALDGRLRSAFSRHGVDFREDGTPVVASARRSAPTVTLAGPDGPGLRWTRRALYRAGFEPVPQDQAPPATAAVTLVEEPADAGYRSPDAAAPATAADTAGPAGENPPRRRWRVLPPRGQAAAETEVSSIRELVEVSTRLLMKSR